MKTPADRGDLENEVKQVRELSTSLLAEWKKLLAKAPAAPTTKDIKPAKPVEKAPEPIPAKKEESKGK